MSKFQSEAERERGPVSRRVRVFVYVCLQGTTLSLTDLMLPIPAVPPSSRKRTCYIISCTYSVKVPPGHCCHRPYRHAVI